MLLPFAADVSLGKIKSLHVWSKEYLIKHRKIKSNHNNKSNFPPKKNHFSKLHFVSPETYQQEVTVLVLNYLLHKQISTISHRQ